ncbi:lactoylglutathione lyase [Pseudomonas sp. HK3]
MVNFAPTRLLHTMLRVKNLDKSIEFYTSILGMEVLRKHDYIEGRFTLAFLGYEDERTATAIELTYNWGEYEYELGKGFGHIAFAVNDLHTLCDHLIKNNIVFTKNPGPMRFDTSEMIAFIVDPDGYSIELIEKQ